ncbi:hypothetical protein V490_00599 [Pseudogymnoascus sp. VKM F-3557]|nr:hypothetical protein V490_00599 [Pseudogymnoascus sp. VKM F-3557]
MMEKAFRHSSCLITAVDNNTLHIILKPHVRIAPHIITFAKMPTIHHTLDARDVAMQLSKRGNWARQEAGVVVVFCIVGVVAIGVIWLCVHKWMLRRRANRVEK